MSLHPKYCLHQEARLEDIVIQSANTGIKLPQARWQSQSRGLDWLLGFISCQPVLGSNPFGLVEQLRRLRLGTC
jgi:hypothetical protein